MTFLDFNGESMALCTARPNRTQRPSLEISAPQSDVEKALSARETRRAYARTFHYSLGYTAWLGSTKAVTDFRQWLLRLKDETIIVPLWDDGIQLAGPANAGDTTLAKTADFPVRYGYYWIICNDDLSTFEPLQITTLDTSTVTLTSFPTLNWPTGSKMFPLFFAKFDGDRPQVAAVTPARASVDLKFTEASPYLYRLNNYSYSLQVVGATIADFANYKLLSLKPEFSRPLEDSEIDIIYTKLGFMREEQTQIYSQPNRRGYELTFYCKHRTQILALEKLFTDRYGPVRPFMVPSGRNDLKLAADLPTSGNPKLFTLEESAFVTDPAAAAHPGYSYIAFVDSVAGDITSDVIDPHKIASVDIAGFHTDANIVLPHTAAGTRTSHLLLGRFAEPKLTWEYITPTKARTTIKVIEVPDEYVTPVSDQPEDVYLYTFTEQSPTPTIWRFTSYENNVVYFGHTYLSGPFSMGSLRNTLKLDQIKLDLTTFDFIGNPLAKFVPFSLDAPLWLDIVRADYANLTNPGKTIFSGEPWQLDVNGDQWKAMCLVFGRYLERPFPGFMMQKVCNFAVYSPLPRCGANKASFRTAGTITAYHELPTISSVDIAGGAGIATDTLQGGFIETGGGINYQPRQILRNIPITGGQRLTINRPVDPAKTTIGQAISVYPGCNGAITTCINVFHNIENFGAHAYVGDVNPSIKAMEAAQPTGGKK